MSSPIISHRVRRFRPTFREIVEDGRHAAAQMTWTKAQAASDLRHIVRASGRYGQARILATLKRRMIKRAMELAPEQIRITVDRDYFVGLLSLSLKGQGSLHQPAHTQLPEIRVKPPHREVAA